MSEFSLARAKRIGLPSFLLSDLFKFCFFALSHPLYFSYFIFFSPYLFKIFSFLSPLFITTTLLLLAFLTTLSPGFAQYDDNLSEHKPGFLTFTYQTVLERLSSKVDENEEEEFQHFEELDEVFKIVFETSTLESVGENPADLLEEVVKETCLEAYEAPVDKCSILESKASELSKEVEEKIPVETTLKWCLEEEKELEKSSYIKENKDDPKPEEKEELFTRKESKDIVKVSTTFTTTPTNNYFADSPGYDFDDQYSLKTNVEEEEESETVASNLGSFGSLRREKEWRRTLACKLFEERHNVDGGEGMDMLWETYEAESDKKIQAKNSLKKQGKKGVLEYIDDQNDDDEYEDETDGQLCCLQALKFSAGKMNLGMGRPNLLKISKAFKGMGWLTRHGKKKSN